MQTLLIKRKKNLEHTANYSQRVNGGPSSSNYIQVEAQNEEFGGGTITQPWLELGLFKNKYSI